MNSWNIGLSSWIIQDGNYVDFRKNEIREFALEFYFQKFSLSELKSKKVALLQDGPLYEINGEAIYKNDDVCIIDFGLLAYSSNSNVQNVKVGDYLTGTIYLGIDYFDYFERLYKINGIPPLIYTWKIEKIFFETTPIIETKDDNGKTERVYDKSRYSTKELEKTDAWSEEEDSANYILICSPIPKKPKYIFSNLLYTI